MVQPTNQQLMTKIELIYMEIKEIKKDVKCNNEAIKVNTDFRQRIVGIFVGMGMVVTLIANAGFWAIKYIKEWIKG